MDDLDWKLTRGNEENIEPIKEEHGNFGKLGAQQKSGLPPVTVKVDGRTFTTTPTFDVFWRYASERQAIEDKRRAGEPQPWTSNKILRDSKFCSVFRVADRGSQFLISEVIERGSQLPIDILFRILVYTTFVRPSTYSLLEKNLAPLTWARYKQEEYTSVLEKAQARGQTIYTGAFQRVAPKLGSDTSFVNHLILLEAMIGDNLLEQLQEAEYMADAFDILYPYQGMGDFNSFQLLLNLSYSPLVNFGEHDFVVAGVGARAGLQKCFAPAKAIAGHEVALIRWMATNQDAQFARMGVRPARLAGKYGLSLVDIEHTLCEVHKYARALGGGFATRARFVPNAMPLPATPVLPRAWDDPARKVVRIRPGKTQKRAQKRYIVAQLLDKRKAEDPNDKEEYLVDWLGYGEKDRTWEPAWMLLEDAPEIVEKFEASHRKKAKKRRIS